MNVNLIQPCGFCHGVQRVVDKTLKIIEDYPSANIYLIGNIVHNSQLAKQLLKHKNVKILENKNHDRLALVKSIKTEKNVLIFSAHGTDPRAIDYAESRGWKVFDLTCPYVFAILSKIKQAILRGYHVAYFGDKNHVEAIAAKHTGGVNLTIYKTKKDLKKVLDMPYVWVMAQTTMNEDEFLATRKWFTEPAQIKFSNTICASSRKRQENAIDAKAYDIVFVISDPASHNGQSLYYELKQRQKQVIFVDPLHIKLTKNMFKNKKDCAIFTSSSVSRQQIDAFIKKLNKLI